jgi:hypothetical protein
MAEVAVGVLYGGEMGARLMRAIANVGPARLMTVLAGRSPATVERARAAGVKDMETLPKLLREVNVLAIVVS